MTTPPKYLPKLSPEALLGVVRVVRAAIRRIVADPALPLWRALQTGELDGWNARMVFNRYVFPVRSVPDWDESPLRTTEDRLYLLNRFLSDVAQRRPHRGGWVVGVYDGGKAA